MLRIASMIPIFANLEFSLRDCLTSTCLRKKGKLGLLIEEEFLADLVMAYWGHIAISMICRTMDNHVSWHFSSLNFIRPANGRGLDRRR